MGLPLLQGMIFVMLQKKRGTYLSPLNKCLLMSMVILTPVDFSAASLNAARYAAHLCLSLHAQLRLLHVVQMPVVYGEIPLPTGNYDDVLDNARSEMQGLIQKLQREAGTGLEISSEVKAGSPMYEIMTEASGVEPFLLVMGTRGLGNLERFILGSTTLNTIKECAVPVLVIPEDFKFEQVVKIGLASDFSNVVEKTPQQFITRLMQQLQAELHIIHNDPTYHEYEPEVMQEGLLLDTMFTGIRHKFHFLHYDFTEEGITNFAHNNDLNWIIIIPKKHGFFEQIFGHQHTRDFVLHACLPVLVLPPREA